MSIDLRLPPPLRGKRILITGGSHGLGRTLALAFLEEGARVAVCARHEGTFGPLREAGAIAMAADVSDPAALGRLVERIGQEWAGLDAVVNNAAVLKQGPLMEQPLEEWSETLAANLTGPYVVIRSALRIMTRGCIVQVTSGLGRFPMEPYGAYCVSKAGLNMLTRTLALALGRRFHVNAIDPGELRTRMNPDASKPPEALVPLARVLVALSHGGPTGRCFRADGSEVPWS
jgi:NAD(P)-dependent dehydrogenase (short-subunit alcohol dehydrogenase family)